MCLGLGNGCAGQDRGAAAPLLIVRDESRRLSLGELLSSIAHLCFTGCFHAMRLRAHAGVGEGVRSERICEGLQSSLFQIDISQVVTHEADEPDSVLDFADADSLSGEGLGEIDFLSVKADAPATGDQDGAIVKRVMRFGQALVRPW